jgi:transposase
VKFFFKLGKTATETWKILQQAFGYECVSRTQCFEWYSRVKTGRTAIDEDPRSGRSSMSTDDIHIEAVRDLILQNRRFTIRENAEDVGITVPRKRPRLWTNQSWVLHHDNAPANSSFLVRNFLAKNETTVVPQPTYSPDLAADFSLFPKLKSTLKGLRFDTFDEIQKNFTKDLFAIPKEAFQIWQKRW